jgi:outer membrane receptor protein involved in Fe transport
MIKANLRVALALALCASVATGALAQTSQGGAPATTAVPDTSGQLQEVVVTAQRRSENLQNVPIAVTAVTAAKLEAAGVGSTAGLANVTPALTFSDVAGFVEPRIRGIGNASAGPAVENEVSTYIDGVYIASAPASLLSLSNIQRVEILKGPQGTLFGRNATGGVIQVVTRDPSSDPHGDAAIGIDSYATVRAEFYATGPILPGVNADIALSAGHQDEGYGRNLATGDDVYRTDKDLAARTKWLMHLGDHTTVRLSADVSQLVTSDPALAEDSGTAPAAYKTSGGVPIRVFTSPWDEDTTYNPLHKTLAGGVSARIDQDVGAVTVTDIAAYRGMTYNQFFDANFAPPGAVPEYEIYTQNDRQVSEELQLAPTHAGKLQWLIGLYYFNLNSRYDPLEVNLGAPGAQSDPLVLRDVLTVDSIAGYGQATYEILTGTHITAGIRYTEEQRTIEGTTGSISAAGVATSHALTPGTVTENTPTWRVSLDHSFTRDLMAYVSYNRGYKSGGFNPASPTAPSYLPEYLDAYEVGLKSELLDRRLRLNAAAFFYNYRNIQVNTYIGSLGVIYNGARAQTYGLDLDFDFRATDQLTFTGGMDLLHDRFTNFPLAVISTPTGFGTWTQAPGSATGNRLPFAPDATLNIGVNYRIPAFTGHLELAVNDLYSTGYYTQPDNRLKQGDYDLLNGSLTWKPASDGYYLRLYVNNALDKAVVDYLAASTSATGASYEPPRIVGGKVGFKF